MPSRRVCRLFGDLDGKLAHLDYWISGEVDCYLSSEEKANEQEKKIVFAIEIFDIFQKLISLS